MGGLGGGGVERWAVREGKGAYTRELPATHSNTGGTVTVPGDGRVEWGWVGFFFGGGVRGVGGGGLRGAVRGREGSYTRELPATHSNTGGTVTVPGDGRVGWGWGWGWGVLGEGVRGGGGGG